MMVFWLVVLWICCSVLNFGLYFAYFQREAPLIARKDLWSDFRFSFCFAVIFGPLGIVAALIFLTLEMIVNNTKFHGLKFIPRVDDDWARQVRNKHPDIYRLYCSSGHNSWPLDRDNSPDE